MENSDSLSQLPYQKEFTELESLSRANRPWGRGGDEGRGVVG
jgi:hypothetical protein